MFGGAAVEVAGYLGLVFLLLGFIFAELGQMVCWTDDHRASDHGIIYPPLCYVCPSEVLCWLVVMLELDPAVTLSLYWFKTFKSSSAEGRLSLGVSIDPG